MSKASYGARLALALVTLAALVVGCGESVSTVTISCWRINPDGNYHTTDVKIRLLVGEESEHVSVRECEWVDVYMSHGWTGSPYFR